ncbi:hypothetical protein [Streptomyces sp. McG7]|uniref:hypothetical protein n=1 Tax=Streptomyces sp. McG7 TaxID=2725486 RepID=UPI001BEA4E4C|nr:hypothetical protein [Streptomyces sp. McG7]
MLDPRPGRPPAKPAPPTFDRWLGCRFSTGRAAKQVGMKPSTTTVIVNLTDHPSDDPETSWIIALDSLDFPIEDVMSELEALAWLAGGEYPVMSNLQSRQGVYNWGSSHSFAEFVLSIASGGIGGLSAMAIDTAVKDLFRKFRERANGDDWGDAISEENASQVARSRIATQYSVLPDELTTQRVETDTAQRTHEFLFRHTDGRTFGAVVGIVKDSPTCMRIWRQVAISES